MRRRRAGWHTVKNENWVVLKLIFCYIWFLTYPLWVQNAFFDIRASPGGVLYFATAALPPDWYGRRIFHLLSLWQMGQMWLAPGIFGSTPGHFCWFWTSPCESHIFLTPTYHKTHLPYHADYFFFVQPTLVLGVEVVRERSKGTAPANRPSDSSPMALDKSRRWVATFVIIVLGITCWGRTCWGRTCWDRTCWDILLKGW